MSSKNEKCGICQINEFKYKCPRCGLKYCSLVCYKNEEKHIHKEKDESAKTGEHPSETKIEKSKVNSETVLPTPELNTLYRDTPELQELLKYNTVKFHLSKVYRILSTDIGDSSEGSTNLNTESKKQLAIDYLNTLLYGGIHYNEAIEEFCEICLQKLNNI